MTRTKLYLKIFDNNLVNELVQAYSNQSIKCLKNWYILGNIM